MIEVREYIDAGGRSPYARWCNRLNAQAAAKVATPLVRMEQGNLSAVKGVGSGVFEYLIDFGKDGDILVILLAGGTKKRQQQAIETGKDLWRDYKRRKQRERRDTCP